MPISTRKTLLVAAAALSVAAGAAGSAQAASFSGNESWTLNPYYGTRGTFFADVTGDGRADAIVVNDDRVTVRRSA